MLAIDDSNGFYMFGGCGAKSGRLADLYKFDVISQKWTFYGSAAPGLRGRGGANLIQCEKKLLAVVGGFAGEELGDAKLFDMECGLWLPTGEGKDVIENVISPRSVCVSGSFLLDEKRFGVIFGGEIDPSEKGHEGAGCFGNDILLLESSDDAILVEVVPAQHDDWPECRGWSDGDTNQNKLYFYGGLSGDDEHPT
eukprot:CAMPEP_0194390378 /NCGR_PEP_ID=MMETSP0174-20130528/109732_1 /TAXON_ID=216777 /ORGANISM="Proboscia alata, Strain PI-D3" /LENGTH=195 /DNA_ID=CAMNT_0039183665 /DNA_START=1 /DNA_END=585 /DNA_ORIENTATION=+